MSHSPHSSTPHAARFRSRKLAFDRSWLVPFRLIAACSILWFPSKLRRLWSLNFMRSYFSFESKGDPLFFLTHRYYLSKTLTVAQRIDCAVAHYSFEGQNYGSIYHRFVYQSPRGFTLWHRVVDGARYELTLCATEDFRYEGDLSVLCFVNGTRVCRVSFSYVNGSLFSQPPEHTMFVTRSQTDRNPELQRFRDCFKQNSPPYFCLASVFGIAMANGMRSIFLVKDEAQIAYQERYAEGFKNSYSVLWKAFGAEEMVDRSAYRMSVPPKLSSFSIVKHRSRALARRRNWLEIALSAQQAMLQDRLRTAPPPIDGVALEHCLGLGSPSSDRRLQPRTEVGGFAFDPQAPHDRQGSNRPKAPEPPSGAPPRNLARKSGAVFVSYASEDAEAAARVAQALKIAGIETWFDRSELRGGEVWERRIRQQVRDCALFVPIVSASTQARSEGYFRLEWRLADERTRLTGRPRTFLLPVCVDAAPGQSVDVPDAFLAVQWTRLPDGKASAAFIEHVSRLLLAASAAAAVPVAPTQLVAASHGSSRRSQAFWGVGALLLVLALAAAALVPPWQRHEHARNVLLPALVDALAKSPDSNASLLDMALEVEKAMPGDRSLARLWPKVATTLSIETQPANAGVYWKDYDTPDAPWRFAGTTPLKDARVPRDLLRVELRKEGFQTIELVSPGYLVHVGTDPPRLKLDRSGSLPPRMVRIPGSVVSQMGLLGLDEYSGTEVPEFLADKYEVTNREYKAFIDAGGYANPTYWRFPVIDGGREIPLTAALARFTDRTGRPGPSTWKAGTYPDGLADHPVAGVSWYEAAAYAAWAGKQLPTVYHWTRLADTWRTKFLLPFSNFNGKTTTAAGSLSGLSSYGVYDVAGNVREWVMNAARSPGERYILGGGYSDPIYAFNDACAQSALDRAPINGFRLIRELPGASAPALARPLVKAARDYTREQPFDDRALPQFAHQFAHDRSWLVVRIDKVVDSDDPKF